MEEEKSPKIISFHVGNNTESLQQEIDSADSDENIFQNLKIKSNKESKNNLESHINRDYYIDHTTGRKRQTLICRQCGLRTLKLCNMKDHIRVHLACKRFRCSICKRGFVQSGNRDRHEAKAECIPNSI